MHIPSGLEDSTRRFVGKALLMRLENGWGWSVSFSDQPYSVPFEQFDEISLNWVRVIPFEFFSAYEASTRGFLGRIAQPGHILNDTTVLAFTIPQGFDWNFTSNICQAWRFFFGDGELSCPTDSFPRLIGPKIIGGYGIVTSDISHHL